MRYFGVVIFGGIAGLGALWVALANMMYLLESESADPRDVNWDFIFVWFASLAPLLMLAAFGVLGVMALARAFRPA